MAVTENSEKKKGNNLRETWFVWLTIPRYILLSTGKPKGATIMGQFNTTFNWKIKYWTPPQRSTTYRVMNFWPS